MSFITKESKTGGTIGQFIVVKPSVAQWSDIEQLQIHNRGANEPKESLDDLYSSIKARGAIVNALKGYLDRKQLFITAGSRRMAVAQALEEEGIEILLPVTLISKPESDEEIAEAIKDNLADNEFRKADSPLVLFNSFRSLRDMGCSLEDIGETTGFSHTQVAWHLKAFESPTLKKEILADNLSVRKAAEFITDDFIKKDKDGNKVRKTVERNGKRVKTKDYEYDEEKIAKAIKAEKDKANKSGKGGKLGGSSGKASKGVEGEGGTTLLRGMKAIRVMLDEPEDNVPLIFRCFMKWLNADKTMSDASFKKIAKSNGFFDEIEWLFDIEFDADKRKAAKAAAKAKKEKEKAAKAEKAKKDNPAVDDDSEDYE